MGGDYIIFQVRKVSANPEQKPKTEMFDVSSNSNMLVQKSKHLQNM